MKRKRLFFITTRLFWPTDEGHKVLLYNYCKGLSECYGYDIYLYSFLEDDQCFQQDGSPSFIKDIFIAKFPPIWKRVFSVLFHSCISTEHWSFQSSLYFSKYNVDNVCRIVQEIHPDVIFVDMIRLSQYYCAFRKFKGKKILFMEDALSKRYVRQIEYMDAESRIEGRYSNRIPRIVDRIINHRFLRNRILRSESKRLKREEVIAARRFDAVIYVNSIEAEEMNKTTGSQNSYTVTQGVDCEYYSASVDVEKRPNSLCYLGNMSVAANADAVRLIMNHIIPLVPSKPVVYFIGNATEELIREFKDNKQCVFEGCVDDLRMAVKSTEIMLAPIAYGTGVKTKVIEGMAMSMPVITNYLGVEGLSVRPGIDLLVSNDYVEIAEMVENLLHDPQKQEELGHNGYEYVLRHHQWKNIYKVFAEMGL